MVVEDFLRTGYQLRGTKLKQFCSSPRDVDLISFSGLHCQSVVYGWMAVGVLGRGVGIILGRKWGRGEEKMKHEVLGGGVEYEWCSDKKDLIDFLLVIREPSVGNCV